MMRYKKKRSTIKLNSDHSVDTKRAKVPVVFYSVTCDLQSTGSIETGRTTIKSRLGEEVDDQKMTPHCSTTTPHPITLVAP
jgi:hypothetical protein